LASLRYVLARRIFNAFITIMLIMALNFALFRIMPGDPAMLMLNRSPHTTDAAYWRNVEIMHLNDSLEEQFVNYYADTFTGEWGISYQWEMPVVDVYGDAIFWTILLVGTSSFLTFLTGIILGRIAARKRGKSADLSITAVSLFFYGMPMFWLSIVLIVVFVSWLGWFPAGGYLSIGRELQPFTPETAVDLLWHMVLPVAALTIGSIAGITLIMRNSLIDVLTEDYIVTAYAKGLSEKEVMRRHAMPNARLPIVTTIAMSTAFVLAGVFQIEIVFGYQGIGWYTMAAIWKQDYPMLQFIFFIGGVAVVIANLVADIVLVYIDPRVTIT
jgi:peptide/nickel transport system permease protein